MQDRFLEVGVEAMIEDVREDTFVEVRDWSRHATGAIVELKVTEGERDDMGAMESMLSHAKRHGFEPNTGSFDERWMCFTKELGE